MKLNVINAVLTAVTALLTSGLAQATPVSLELMLLVDTSGSISNHNYNKIKQSYADAFRSSLVQNAILSSALGSMAVTYIEWSNGQSTRVGWTLIDSAASANAFADRLSTFDRFGGASTAVQDAIGNSYKAFGGEVGGLANGYESLQQIIEMAGDGADNFSSSYARTCGGARLCGRDAALQAGVDTVNGIYIPNEANLAAYYDNNVIGGVGGHSTQTDYSTFVRDIALNIVADLNPAATDVPEPGSLALAGVALAAATAVSRRCAA